ncbi:UDP-glycosyltransferase UGT5-like [Drosophila sulfurigaster albostrigata]|uniref:UDP-glycosyltransferase UGT5-like n=1 Tax=Drosophila sulfurigaster albostrigata TaxID=89887 RepID=UPI002D21BA6E|nr:UDP-glycosyltransferase UGT5-like [Drosophila sulfurigaster albostrigata]
MRLQRLPLEVIGLAVLLLPVGQIWAARILLVFPYDMHSQCSLLTPFLKALRDRGHELTLIHAFANCPIAREIHSIFVNDEYETGLNYDDFWSLSKWSELQSIRNFMVKINLNVLVNAEVQMLMRSNVSYDLIVMEPSHTDALFGMAAHFNATLMGLATCGGDWNLDSLVGHSAASTFEPIMPIGFKRSITLIDRFYNWMLISEEWMMHKLFFLPGLRALHDQFFGHLTQSFEDIRQNFSLILLNQHFSLFDARPNVPSLIEVGGMHVPKKRPELLPDLAKFVEDSPHGVILMTLGTELRSCDLSTETLSIILKTFESLPQRIIWKFEGNKRPNISRNIYMNEWLPVQALLAHPNVRLFISHGGILGTLEAAYYAKPVLGMPLFFDQIRNMDRMNEAGAAIIVDILKLTRHDFESAIKQLLDHPKYWHNAQTLSQRIRDQPMHPLDTAVFWTEYIIRHRGAPYMRVSPSNMKFIDYYCVDKLLMIIARLSFSIGIVIYIVRKLLQYREKFSRLLRLI